MNNSVLEFFWTPSPFVPRHELEIRDMDGTPTQVEVLRENDEAFLVAIPIATYSFFGLPLWTEYENRWILKTSSEIISIELPQ